MKSESIGERLKLLRGRDSRPVFADNFGISVATLARYESGESAPNSDFIRAICEKYQVSADWIISGSSSHLPNSMLEEEITENSKMTSNSSFGSYEIPKQGIDEWLKEISDDQFYGYWQDYIGSGKALRGWLQVELVNRFPEFVKWIKYKDSVNEEELFASKSSQHTSAHQIGEKETNAIINSVPVSSEKGN